MIEYRRILVNGFIPAIPLIPLPATGRLLMMNILPNKFLIANVANDLGTAGITEYTYSEDLVDGHATISSTPGTFIKTTQKIANSFNTKPISMYMSKGISLISNDRDDIRFMINTVDGTIGKEAWRYKYNGNSDGMWRQGSGTSAVGNTVTYASTYKQLSGIYLGPKNDFGNGGGTDLHVVISHNSGDGKTYYQVYTDTISPSANPVVYGALKIPVVTKYNFLSGVVGDAIRPPQYKFGQVQPVLAMFASEYPPIVGLFQYHTNNTDILFHPTDPIYLPDLGFINLLSPKCCTLHFDDRVFAVASVSFGGIKFFHYDGEKLVTLSAFIPVADLNYKSALVAMGGTSKVLGVYTEASGELVFYKVNYTLPDSVWTPRELYYDQEGIFFDFKTSMGVCQSNHNSDGKWVQDYDGSLSSINGLVNMVQSGGQTGWPLRSSTTENVGAGLIISASMDVSVTRPRWIPGSVGTLNYGKGYLDYTVAANNSTAFNRSAPDNAFRFPVLDRNGFEAHFAVRPMHNGGITTNQGPEMTIFNSHNSTNLHAGCGLKLNPVTNVLTLYTQGTTLSPELVLSYVIPFNVSNVDMVIGFVSKWLSSTDEWQFDLYLNGDIVNTAILNAEQHNAGGWSVGIASGTGLASNATSVGPLCFGAGASNGAYTQYKSWYGWWYSGICRYGPEMSSLDRAKLMAFFQSRYFV